MPSPVVLRPASAGRRRRVIMRAAVRTALSVAIANIAGAFVAVTTLSLVERPEQLVFAWGNGVVAAMFATVLAAAVGLAASLGGWVASNAAALIRRAASFDRLPFVLAATGCGAAAAAAIASTFPVNSLVAAIVEGAGVAVAAFAAFSLASKRPHPEREIA